MWPAGVNSISMPRCRNVPCRSTAVARAPKEWMSFVVNGGRYPSSRAILSASRVRRSATASVTGVAIRRALGRRSRMRGHSRVVEVSVGEDRDVDRGSGPAGDSWAGPWGSSRNRTAACGPGRARPGRASRSRRRLRGIGNPSGARAVLPDNVMRRHGGGVGREVALGAAAGPEGRGPTDRSGPSSRSSTAISVARAPGIPGRRNSPHRGRCRRDGGRRLADRGDRPARRDRRSSGSSMPRGSTGT